MKRLIQLAKRIKDKQLREKVIDLLNNPKLSSEAFKKYKPEEISKVKTPFTVGNVTVERGNLIRHTIAVTELSVQAAKILENQYGIPIDEDSLIAAAILHDLMKIFEWKIEKNEPKHTGILLDHSILCAAELYHRNFPEKVIHIVASHFGESGPTPPRNFEALILHYIDTLLSLVESHLYSSSTQPLQLVVLDEETIKKLAGEDTEK